MPPRHCSPIYACSRSISGRTIRTRTWWSKRPRRSRSRPSRPKTIAVATELGNLSLALRSIATEDGADKVAAYSHTWDSEATHLSDPPDLHAEEPAPPPKPEGEPAQGVGGARRRRQGPGIPEGAEMMRATTIVLALAAALMLPRRPRPRPRPADKATGLVPAASVARSTSPSTRASSSICRSRSAACSSPIRRSPTSR